VAVKTYKELVLPVIQSIATQKTLHLRILIIYGITTQNIQHYKASSNNIWITTLKIPHSKAYMALQPRRSNITYSIYAWHYKPKDRTLVFPTVYGITTYNIQH